MHFNRLNKIDLVDYVQSIDRIKQSAQYQLNQFPFWRDQLRFVLDESIPDEKSNPLRGVTMKSVVWLNDDSLHIDPTDNIQPHYYKNRITCNLSVIYGNNAQERREWVFETSLIVELFFNANDERSIINVEFFTDLKWELKSLDRKILDLYDRLGLNDSQFVIDGENFIQRFTQVVLQQKNDPDAHPFYRYLEIIYALQRNRYAIAQMKLYSPYLDNPLWHAYDFNGSEVFPSHRGNFDERYLMYCEFAYQAIYNFWERIGSIIALCVPTGLPPTQIFFTKVIEELGKDSSVTSDTYFGWLLSYKRNEYKQLNDDRKKIVHYNSLTAQFTQSHLDNAAERDKVEKLVAELQNHPSILIQRFQEALEGIRHVILFLEGRSSQIASALPIKA